MGIERQFDKYSSSSGSDTLSDVSDYAVQKDVSAVVEPVVDSHRLRTVPAMDEHSWCIRVEAGAEAYVEFCEVPDGSGRDVFLTYVGSGEYVTQRDKERDRIGRRNADERADEICSILEEDGVIDVQREPTPQTDYVLS